MFLLMIYAGALLGALLDGAALLRRGRGGWQLALLDCLACMGAGVVIALALIYTGQNGFRLYGVVGLVLGWLIYDLGVRSLLRSIARLWHRRMKISRGSKKRAGNERLKANTYENTKKDGGKSREQA